MERSRSQRTQGHGTPSPQSAIEKMTMRRLIKALLILQVCQVIGFPRSLGAGEAKPNWQAEWDRTVRAAEQEGQVMTEGTAVYKPGLTRGAKSSMVCFEISANGKSLSKACVGETDQFEVALAKPIGDRDTTLSVTVFAARSL